MSQTPIFHLRQLAPVIRKSIPIYSLEEYAELVEAPACFLEIIPDNEPFRAHFDIDFDKSNPKYISNFETSFTNTLIKYIKEVCNTISSAHANAANIFSIFDNSDEDKLSIHVLFPHLIFPDSPTFINFAQPIANEINNIYNEFFHLGANIIDMSVINRSKGRTLRAPYSCKFADDIPIRQKLPKPNTTIINGGMVSYITPHPNNVFFEKTTRQVSTKKQTFSKDIIHEYQKCLDDMKNNFPYTYAKLSKILESLTFQGQIGNLVSFAKIGDTDCIYCDSIHTKDRALYIITTKNYLIVKCYQYFAANPNAEVQCFRYAPYPTFCEEYPTTGTLVTELDKYINYLKQAKTLFIKAPTGYGKTKGLFQLINEDLPFASLIAVSPRQSFASNLKARQNKDAKKDTYKIEFYSDIKGNISLIHHKRAVVQAESLHRVVTTRVKILVLDELVSILNQFRSKTMSKNNPTKNFRRFCELIANAEMVICMDAYLCDADVNFINSIRKKSSSQTIIIDSPVQNPPSITEHTSINTIYSEMNAAIKRGEPIAICSSVAANATEAIAEYVKELDFGDTGRKCNVQCITSLTDEAIKEGFFGENLPSILDNTDVFIYSPTLSAGVSYENERFIKLFAMFSVNSASVFDCAQMINRIRNYKEMHVIINGTHSKTDSNTLLYDYIKSLCKRGEETTRVIPTAFIEEKGYEAITDSTEFKLWHYLERRDRFMRNRFKEIFLSMMQKRGSIITKYEEKSAKSTIAKEIKEIKTKNKEKKIAAILNAEYLTGQEIHEGLTFQDNSPQFLINVKKTNLLNMYNCDIKKPENIEIALDSRNSRIFFHRKYFMISFPCEKSFKDDQERMNHISNSIRKIVDIPESETKNEIIPMWFADGNREKVINSLYILEKFFKYPMFMDNSKMIITKEQMKEIHEKLTSPKSPQEIEFSNVLYMMWCPNDEMIKGPNKVFFEKKEGKEIVKVLQRILKFMGFKLEPDKGRRGYLLYDEFANIFNKSGEFPTLGDMMISYGVK